MLTFQNLLGQSDAKTILREGDNYERWPKKLAFYCAGQTSEIICFLSQSFCSVKMIQCFCLKKMVCQHKK